MVQGGFCDPLEHSRKTSVANARLLHKAGRMSDARLKRKHKCTGVRAAATSVVQSTNTVYSSKGYRSKRGFLKSAVESVLSSGKNTGDEATIDRLQKTVVEPVNALEPSMEALSLDELRDKTAEFRERLNNGASLDSLLPEAFAVVRETSKRVLGLRHFDVQLLGGAVLHEGCIAEMYTGEGKTLVATLPSYLNALTGRGVLVGTVNDYLAKRDMEQMGQIHRALGLTVGIVLQSSAPEERKEAYAQDITYCTCQELGFDYLRDNNFVKESPDLVLRPDLHFIIVDEVDSILVDEGRNPLILSEVLLYDDAYQTKFPKAAEVAAQLEEGVHYKVKLRDHNAELLDAGMLRAEELIGVKDLWDLNDMWGDPLLNAIKAKSVFLRDVHYIVKDGKVILVDQNSGRAVPNRRYGEQMHEALEAKEGVELQNPTKNKAIITYSRFFKLFEKASGMTGTARTEAAELWTQYKLGVVTVPSNRPNIRKDYPLMLYMTEEAKFAAAFDEFWWAHKVFRPVLVGTTSVEGSERISGMLRENGIPHSLLNARPKYAAA
eukprot:CAMPEP_0118955520 /NCGR_PEP_ID=MMETSP1169-20130426/60101_1 /TAXON_ID=36882 /ORGANISM="Pyramimonas obovata, Strain CCMP722" /LENGTH=548 /DNA_ID=CAMNT_0006903389 /DNA_START=57 /DNA_END=1699 /DNA_ORIENTATION=+